MSTSTTATTSLSQEEETLLRDNLKRCRKEVLDAAIEFRTTGNAKKLPEIVLGIIERFLEPEVRPRFQEENASELHLMNDLGADSLIVVEIVVTIEETLKISIPNEEIATLQTIGDVTNYIKNKIDVTRNKQEATAS